MPLRILRSKVYMFQQCMVGCVTFSTVRPKVATIGIDLGCKNSRVAIVDSLVPKVVCCEIGRFMPSYVTVTHKNSYMPYGPYPWALQHLDGFGKRIEAGELAKGKILRQPSDVVFNIKNLIGKQFDDVYIQQLRERVRFGIIEGPKGEAWVEMRGMKISPIEMTRVILSKLKDIVQMYQFHHILKAVISVPAFFSEQQREDIISVGNKAGFKILQLIDEPKAAALSSTTIEEGTVVVFGMGAGSYSISILHVSRANIEVKAQFGDTSVGGDQFDNILLDYFVTQIIRFHSVDISGDTYAMTVLAEVVEKVKVRLSTQLEVTVSIPCLTASAQGLVNFSITISRSKFENLAAKLIEQIQFNCQNILKQCDLTDKDIDEIVLMGGMTRVPNIQKIISEVFGKHQSTRVNPEEAVVIGSAIQAALIAEDQREICEDMIPLSIGIESAEGIFTRIIPRHTPVPTKQTVKIPAWCGYGESLRVRIYLGEHVMVRHNMLLGEVDLSNYGSSCQGPLSFELTFEVDKDYVVEVNARLEDADDSKRSVMTIPIREKVCKNNVNKAVINALLDWPMYIAEIRARLRNLARYIMNTLDDVLSTRKDELPKDLCEDAVKALADLRMALRGDDNLLKDKMLAAQSVESKILHWKLPSESPQSPHEDFSEYK